MQDAMKSLPFKRIDPSILLRSSRCIISVQKVMCNNPSSKRIVPPLRRGFIVGFTASFSAWKNLTIAVSKTEVPAGLQTQS